ncbi:MAG: flagellar biosynthesis protein FliQ [Deltaproteobacteria bacterium]|nr:flagellar biosynthesis protein FliQ [Deltaproteobacteria bacterium]
MESFVISITQKALYLTLILSAPSVGIALVVGLLISLVQATTQIQEQTLTFVPKLAAVVLSLVLLGSWMLMEMVRFTEYLLKAFPRYL